MDELYRDVVAILTRTFEVDEARLSPEVTFEALDLDSLDLVELTLVVEDELGVRLEDEELEHIRTVGDAVAAIAAKRGVTA